MLGQVYIIFTFVQGFRGEDNIKLPRYVIEPGMKPAIVGSYSYNLLKSDFELFTNATVPVTETTSITSSTFKEDNTYRKHASVTATLKQFDWWTRSRIPRNITRKKLYNTFKQTMKSL